MPHIIRRQELLMNIIERMATFRCESTCDDSDDESSSTKSVKGIT